jgi:hypothetical protein
MFNGKAAFTVTPDKATLVAKGGGERFVGATNGGTVLNDHLKALESEVKAEDLRLGDMTQV